MSQRAHHDDRDDLAPLPGPSSDRFCTFKDVEALVHAAVLKERAACGEVADEMIGGIESFNRGSVPRLTMLLYKGNVGDAIRARTA